MTGNNSPTDSRKRQVFRKSLLAWWERNKIGYPWRGYKNPFHILLTEILLRKTNAEKVQRLVPSVIEHLPTPEAILSKPESYLEKLLHPFGMQKRKAREVRLLTESLVKDFGGNVPADGEDLKELPGVGDYIANAVLCFAYNQRTPVVDTNVIRVLGRVFGVTSDRRRPRTDPELWRAAAELLPRKRVQEYNWALLDLGKKLCKAQNPRCLECPLNPMCNYYRLVVLAGPTPKTRIAPVGIQESVAWQRLHSRS